MRVQQRPKSQAFSSSRGAVTCGGGLRELRGLGELRGRGHLAIPVALRIQAGSHQTRDVLRIHRLQDLLHPQVPGCI